MCAAMCTDTGIFIYCQVVVEVLDKFGCTFCVVVICWREKVKEVILSRLKQMCTSVPWCRHMV